MQYHTAHQCQGWRQNIWQCIICSLCKKARSATTRMDFKGMDTKATASEPFTGGTVIPPNHPEPIYIYMYIMYIQAYRHTGTHTHIYIYIHTVYTHMYLHMSIEEPHRARHLWCCENRSDIFPCLELPAEHQELCRKSMINSIQSRWLNATVEWLPSTNGRTFLAAWKWDIMRLSAIRAAVSATLNPLGNSLTLVILSHVFRPYTVCLSLCFFWDQSIWLTTSSKSCSCFVRSPIICAIPQRDVRKSSQGSSCVSWGTTWNFVEAFPQPHTLCILGHWWCHSGSALNVPGL